MVWPSEFIGTFPITAIQCSFKDEFFQQCPQEAIAYVFKPSQHFIKDAVPALCGDHCKVEIERIKPGEDIVFNRLNT